MRGFFVTGTDTGVGKTCISAALLEKLNQQGIATVAMKPIASGCQQTPQGLRNDDALLLQQAASVELAYDDVNPYAFEPAIAPHLAAEQAGVVLEPEIIRQQFKAVAARGEVAVVEGVGGWHVPLNDHQSMIHLARLIDLPVILVVGMRLGCLNHALLTAEAIKRDGLLLAGWVANQIDADMALLDENIATLKNTLSAPFLGTVPFQNEINNTHISSFLSLP